MCKTVSIWEALDGGQFEAQSSLMVILIAMLLDPVTIVMMLGTAALFRGSIVALIVAALALVGLSIALGSSTNPAAYFGAAAVWGTVGHLVLRKRPKPLFGSDAVDDVLDAGKV